MDTILTVSEAAKLIKISKAKLYMLIAKNEIPHIKLDRNVRLWESDLKRWLDAQTVRQPGLDFGNKKG